jgi:uncharacterized OsmC-like protein
MTSTPQQQNEIHRNGIDVSALYDTLDAVRADGHLAQFRFRARNQWLGGGHNRSCIQSFSAAGVEDHTRTVPFVLDADEPPALLGKDAGANPVEFVLHALAACMTTSLTYHAAARGIDIQAIDSELEGDLDLRGFLGLSDEVRKGFQQVRVRMRVKTAASPQLLWELTRFSPVHDIVSRSLPVETLVETY